jgi:hypothetical protein
VPTVSYGTYLRGQQLTAALLKSAKMQRPSTARREFLKLIKNFLIWVIIFLLAFAVVSEFRESLDNKWPYAITLLAVCIFLFGFASYYRQRKLKNAFNALSLNNYHVYIGAKGILIGDAHSSCIFKWSFFSACAKADRDIFLITRNHAFISVPEAVLRQMPDAAAMTAFIDAMISTHNKPVDAPLLTDREKLT